MKKTSIFLMGIFLLSYVFLMSSCARLQKVSDKQLLQDLSTHEDIVTIFESELFKTKPFKYSSHKITKRQTNFEKKEDIIYCNLSVENDNYSVNADCILNYNYYDEGGWVLDHVNVTERTVIPIASFSNEETWDVIIKNRLDCIDFDGSETRLNVVKTSDVEVQRSEIISENGEYKMHVFLKIKSSLTILECYIEIPFDEERGWSWEDRKAPPPVTLTKIVEADYKKALGVFSGPYGWYHDQYTLYVDSIDSEAGTAKIRLYAEGTWVNDGWVNDGKAITAEFNKLDSTINVNYILSSGFNVEYDPETDTWKDGLYEMKRKSAR